MEAPEQPKTRVVVKRKKPAAPTPAPPNGLTRNDLDMLHKLADYLQRVNLAEYVRLTQKPKRLIGLNFIGGVARGFGMAVGFTLLGALGIYVLNQLNVLNLPLIGDLIAQLLEYVELSRGARI